MWICDLNSITYLAEMDCTDFGGQFNGNFTKSPDYYGCMNENTRDNINFSVSYYPICAGVSCNETEVESVFLEIMSGELRYGNFASITQLLCDSTIRLSASTNRNGVMTFATLVYTIYAM